MSYTFKPITSAITRWTRSGVCDGPMGQAGIRNLVSTAYASLVAAPWVRSSNPGSIPVHTYDRTQPTGDAYRATFGYDKAAYTEQSCCGAVCYTAELPRVSGTIASVAVHVIGDRYLNDGAILTAHISDSPSPPTWDEVLAETVGKSALICVAETVDNADIVPNFRADTAADVVISFATPPSAKRYVHFVLRCANYLTSREGWIEGGAMVEPSSISIATSDDLEAAPEDIACNVGTLLATSLRAASGPDPTAEDYNPNMQVAKLCGRDTDNLAFAICLPPPEKVGGKTTPMRFADIGVATGTVPALTHTISGYQPATVISWGFDVVNTFTPIYAIWGDDNSPSYYNRLSNKLYAGKLRNSAQLYLTKWVGGLCFFFPRDKIGGAFSALSASLRAINPHGATYVLRLFKSKSIPLARSVLVNGARVTTSPALTTSNHILSGRSALISDTIDPWHFPYDICDADIGGTLYFQAPGTIATTFGAGPASQADPALALELQFIASLTFSDNDISDTETSTLQLALPPGFKFDPATECLEALIVPLDTVGTSAEPDTTAVLLYDITLEV